MASDTYDPLPDLGRLLDAALRAGRDGTVHAERIADGIGLKACPRPEAAENALRDALGIPGPRTVTYDMNDVDRYSTLTGALEEYAAQQRDRAQAENGRALVPRRLKWAEQADWMRRRAYEAFSAPRDGREVPGDG